MESKMVQATAELNGEQVARFMIEISKESSFRDHGTVHVWGFTAEDGSLVWLVTITVARSARHLVEYSLKEGKLKKLGFGDAFILQE